jgi:hypothetical protein
VRLPVVVRLVPGKDEEHVTDRELPFAQGLGDLVETSIPDLAKRARQVLSGSRSITKRLPCSRTTARVFSSR